MWLQLNREGIAVARCTVARLMRELGPRAPAAASGSAPRSPTRPKSGPRTWWAAGSAHPLRTGCGSPTIPTSRPGPGWSTSQLVIDAYSRRIPGWRTATSMRTGLVLDAPEQPLWTRRRDGNSDLAGLLHHTDAGPVHLNCVH